MQYTFNRPGATTILLANSDRASFLPGKNEMDDATWAEVSQYPSVLELIESTDLQINVEPAKAAKTPAKPPVEK